MSGQLVRVSIPRPVPPKYIPGRCYALKTPGDTSTHCMAKDARLYPIGWRCDPHAPGARKTSSETSPEPRKEAA